MRVLGIMLTWNRFELTRTTLRSLKATADPRELELVIVDNGSEPMMKAWLNEWWDDPLVKAIIQFPHNVGSAMGWNAGMAKYYDFDRPVMFIQNDLEFMVKHWISEMLRILRDHPKVAIVQGNARQYPELRNASGTFLETNLIHTPWMLRPDFMEEVGYCDRLYPDHLWGGVDVIYWNKAHRNGWQTGTAVRAMMRHLGEPNSSSEKRTGLQMRAEAIRRRLDEYANNRPLFTCINGGL